MIDIQNVSFAYPRTKNKILSDISMSFSSGEICALTGTNGCGKTTLTKLMVGILRPDSGRILIDNEDIASKNLFEIGQRVGYVFQNPVKQLFCSTVYEEIAFGLKNRGASGAELDEQVRKYMELFHISHHAEDYPGSLSHGEKQRTVLASVLSLGTKYLVLDEPTTGLDMRGRHELGDMLTALKTENGCGMIIVSHERGFIEKYAGREVIMT